MWTRSKKKFRSPTAQATLEFAFTFIIVVLMLYGCVRIMQWLGLVLGSPGQKHHQGLYSLCASDSPSCNVYDQLVAAENASGQTLPPLNAVFTGQLIHP